MKFRHVASAAGDDTFVAGRLFVAPSAVARYDRGERVRLRSVGIFR